ncbi:aldo/keto reductase [Sphaerisporangium sp. NPDC088356]|uniref:aldo/keto reductase n=1 Tax=Sphaerisporangium sp. NPDC088356 TaxID=3154871 RepID=UPI003440365D
MRNIDKTDLSVFPLCLGGNVFGWTADRDTSFAVLDAYAEAGGNFIDTADSYSAWIPGNEGGESETIIGEWMAERGNRDSLVVATKVGQQPGAEGLSAANIRSSAEGSLRRLRTDRIDLYYAHSDDRGTPLEETLTAFDELVREGKVRHIGASNYEADRLEEALAVSDRLGLARYVALQQHYNLVEREEYEGRLEEVVARAGLSSVPYFALAKGFLTGKYRPGVSVDSARAGGASPYLQTERGRRVLEALDKVAANHGVEATTVALAWLLTRPTVAAPIASARVPEQVPALVAAADLVLSPEEVRLLDEASA